MDPFRINKFHDITEARYAEQQLKKIGLPVILTSSSELYVSTEHIETTIRVLGLPHDIADTKQPGPWCPQCGQQLVSRKKNARFFSSSENLYCYKCNDEIKATSSIDRFKKNLRKMLVKMGYHSKPAFIIIGAQKAGTSALFEILKQHPQLVAPVKKEVRFFDDFSEITYGDFVSYHDMFPLPYRLNPDKLTFEASPSYLFNPVCPLRIYRYDPEILLIVILREPISRAFSAWKMHRRFAHSSNPFIRKLADHRIFVEAVKEELKELDTNIWEKDLFAYIKRGIYIEQLERYLQYFPRDSLLVIEQSRLLHDPQTAFASVFRFLGINDRFIIKTKLVNSATNNEEMTSEVRDILRSFYRPYNERLFSLLGTEYDW
jgi:predicted RNA-binding Zn-ribbon protein involved in translation (DUF1610 family)